MALDIAEPNVENLIRHAFRRISIRLVAQQFRDRVLVVGGPSFIQKTEGAINGEYPDQIAADIDAFLAAAE